MSFYMKKKIMECEKEIYTYCESFYNDPITNHYQLHIHPSQLVKIAKKYGLNWNPFDGVCE